MEGGVGLILESLNDQCQEDSVGRRDRGKREVKSMKIDTEHSEMFPYAIALARAKGADKIYIGEPRLKGSESGRWVEPDVLGIRASADKPYIIIECEKSHGNIFDEGGKIDNWSRDKELRAKTEFHFILRGKAWYRREQITKFLGSDARYYNFDEMKTRVEPKIF